MIFVERLCPALIRVAPPWRTLEETARGLVETLAAQAHLSPAAVEEAVAAVLAREADHSTALLDVAAGVPHARLDVLDRAGVALAVSPQGLYEPVPTVRVSIVALVLSPRAAIDEHLRMLASISTALRSAYLRDALLSVENAEAAHRVLLAHRDDIR